MSGTPRKILVRAPQWLGDAVVSTVFLARLKRREPESEITVLCVPALTPLFSAHPDVAAVIELPYPRGTVFEAARRLRAQNFDEVYVLPRSFRAALESFLARIPRRIGYSGDGRGWLLTTRLRYDPKRHYAHRYLALLGEENFPLDQAEPYFPAEEPRSEEIRTLREPLLGVAPVSIAPSRTWDPARFADVASRWRKDTGGDVVLFGSPRERAAVEAVSKRVEGGALNSAGELSLSELGWTIRKCKLLIGNDSGLMHVASAFRVPSVIVFGASDPEFALPPWGRFFPLQHKEIFCVPCLRNQCVRMGADHNACLKAVTTMEVHDAMAKVLS